MSSSGKAIVKRRIRDLAHVGALELDRARKAIYNTSRPGAFVEALEHVRNARLEVDTLLDYLGELADLDQAWLDATPQHQGGS